MKERMLVLAKAYPTISKKYQVLLCIGGVTEGGEWRRIYPIPLDAYVKAGKFKKREWIEYEIVDENPEHRRESKRVDPDSIKPTGERAEEWEVRKLLKERLTTIEKLKERYEDDGTSLGVVKPILEDFKMKKREKAKEWERRLLGQQTLDGRPAVPIDLVDKWIGYDFRCHPKCNGHSCMCVDIEVGNLYRKLRRKKLSEDEIYRKLRYRLYHWMMERDLFFIMGTESKYGEWIIVSLFYPRRQLTLTELSSP